MIIFGNHNQSHYQHCQFDIGNHKQRSSLMIQQKIQQKVQLKIQQKIQQKIQTPEYLIFWISWLFSFALLLY